MFRHRDDDNIAQVEGMCVARAPHSSVVRYTKAPASRMLGTTETPVFQAKERTNQYFDSLGTVHSHVKIGFSEFSRGWRRA